MTTIGLHNSFAPGGQAASASLDRQDPQSRTIDEFGRLADGLAHGFNNLLTLIAGYSNVLLGLRDLPADGRRSAQEIKQAAERARSARPVSASRFCDQWHEFTSAKPTAAFATRCLGIT